MSKSFEPEAHDIGKLLDLQGTELGQIIRANNHVFLAPDSHPLDFSAHGLVPPDRSNTTWIAALLHHKPPQRDELTKLAEESGDEYRSEALECVDLNAESALSFADRATVFLMIIADHMGSATSRTISDSLKRRVQPALPKEAGSAETHGSNIPRQLIRLWNKAKKIEPQSAFRTKQDLQMLLDYVASDGADFLKRFEAPLRRLPEDKFPLMNLTSLYTHCELVGKLYRLLDGSVERLAESRQLRLDGKNAGTVPEAEDSWSLTFARCEIRSPHQPVRVGDLNVLRLRNELVKALSHEGESADHVLLFTADTLWLVFPGNNREIISRDLHNYLGKLSEMGFDPEIIVVNSPIGRIQNIDPAFFLDRRVQELDDARKQWDSIRKEHDQASYGRARGRYTSIGKDISAMYALALHHVSPDTIAAAVEPPICEICQRAPGEEQTYRERERQAIDYLCANCLSIRKSGERFHKLSQWGEDNSRVAWIRVLLDKRLMEDVISELYFKHTDGTFPNSPEVAKQIKEQFRNLGLLADFVNDYFSFVRRFAEEIFTKFGGPVDDSPARRKNIELLDEEFLELFVLRMDETGILEEILRTFVTLVTSEDSGFPDCAARSPVKLRVSVSRAKYPFFEHWAFLRDNEAFLRLQVPGRVHLTLNLDEYERLAACEVQRGIGRAFFHRLLAIESRTRSRLMVRAELAPEANDLRDVREFKQRLLRLDATAALTIDKLLSYAKILDL